MKRFHHFLWLLVFSASVTYAQTAVKTPPKECNALLARQLVEQQAEEGKSVAETDRRVNILLRVADFLWMGDQETARKYFAEAFQIAGDRFRQKGVEKTETGSITVYQPDYRFEVISAIAKRDAEWAKKLSEAVLKEFDEDAEKDKRGEFDKDNEVRELIYIAAQTAKENPNLALTLARRTMRYRLMNAWYSALYQMAYNNQPLADQIYGELLANYSNTEVFRLLYLSAYPFGSERIIGVEKYNLGTSVPANFSPNRNLQRQFLIILFRRIMKLTPESTTKSLQSQIPETAMAVMALNDLEPIIAQQFPDLAASFSQAKIQANSTAAGDAMESAKNRDEAGKSFNKPFDEKLAEVEQADETGKLDDGRIFQLVNAAKTDENYKKAETWLDKVKEDNTREGLTNFFYFRRSKLATEENRFDEARRYALKVPKIEHRAVLFFDIAEAKMKEPMTKQDSLDTLLEVSQTANKSPDTVEKAQVLLGLAFMYEKVDHYNALGALAEAIKTANKLESPDLLVGSVTQIVRGKSFTHFSSYSVPGFAITETFYAISKKDFLTALTNATNFSDRYLRTLAVLATVKDCEKNDKLPKAKPKN